MKDISKTTDVKLVGLEYRVKTKDSFLRKVNTDSDNSVGLDRIDNVIASTNDVIRYTYQSSSENLSDSYKLINKELQSRGYSKVKVKNTWLDDNNPYKGVNCIFKSSSGQNFEVQFHSPESFELKNGELHKLYEEQRILTDKKSNKYIELEDKMFELSDKLVVPKNIKEVK